MYISAPLPTIITSGPTDRNLRGLPALLPLALPGGKLEQRDAGTQSTSLSSLPPSPSTFVVLAAAENGDKLLLAARWVWARSSDMHDR